MAEWVDTDRKSTLKMGKLTLVVRDTGWTAPWEYSTEPYLPGCCSTTGREKTRCAAKSNVIKRVRKVLTDAMADMPEAKCTNGDE